MQSFNFRPPSPGIGQSLAKIRSTIREAVESARPATAEERRKRLAFEALTRASITGSPWNGPKHVYAGTVRPNVKARRRARNKMARQSRRANR